MNKYVVAVYYYNTDELLQEVVQAKTKLEAAASYLDDHKHDSFKALTDFYCFEDIAKVSVIEIKNTASNWSFPNLALLPGFSMRPKVA